MYEGPSPDDYRLLSLEDLCLKEAFGRFDPPLASFSHCIFVPTAERLRIVANVVECKVGLFGGIAPLVKADGTPYAPPDEGIIEDFVLWAEKKNQEYLYDYYSSGAENAPLLISARTAPALLRQMSDAGSCEGSFPYEIYIERISDWIEKLGWACVPLESEGDFAMFVAGHGHTKWVREVRESIGSAAFTLIRDGDRWRWPPIHEDPKNRSPRMERRKHGWEPTK